MKKVKANPNKVSFGKRKTGRPQKSYNKHTPRPKPSRGQG